MSISPNERAALAAVPSECERDLAETGASSERYESYLRIAHELSTVGLAKNQSSTFMEALREKRDIVLSGDEISFVKTAILVPALRQEGVVVAVLPNLDILKRVKRLLQPSGLNVASFDLAPSKIDKMYIWEQMDAGQIDVVLVSIGRLSSKRFCDRMARRPIALLALAHAHVMSPWSHRFNPDYRNICAYGFVRRLNDIPKIAHVWSADKFVHQDVQKLLTLHRPYKANVSSTTAFTPRIQALSVVTDVQRLDQTREFVCNFACQGVIYVSTLKQLFDTKRMLEDLGEQVEVHRPGMDEFTMQKIRSGFERGDIRIVLSQGAFLSTLERAPGLEFVVFNGMPDSIETLGQELLSHETATPTDCLCLSSEHDFYHHRFAIDKNYPDALMLRLSFQSAKDVFGRSPQTSLETLKSHIKVATPFPEDDIAQCINVMQREGLIERTFDPEYPQPFVKQASGSEQELSFWHEYPLRKLEQISRLEKTREFLGRNGDLGKSLRDNLEASA